MSNRILDPRPVTTLSDYVQAGGGTGYDVAGDVEPEAVIEEISAAGLRGRGGAGFPTGQKWATTFERETEVTTVVVNAAEGEPGTFKDRALMRTNPYRILEGALIAARVMGATRIRLGLPASFRREITRLNAAIEEMRAAGWTDGIDVALLLGPESYLFGEETGMLEVMDGRQPFPRVVPPYLDPEGAGPREQRGDHGQRARHHRQRRGVVPNRRDGGLSGDHRRHGDGRRREPRRGRGADGDVGPSTPSTMSDGASFGAKNRCWC